MRTLCRTEQKQKKRREKKKTEDSARAVLSRLFRGTGKVAVAKVRLIRRRGMGQLSLVRSGILNRYLVASALPRLA